MPISIEMEDRLPVTNTGEQHVPAVLLVDTSYSMSGAPIAELNQGLKDFYTALSQDDLAMGRAEVTVISFNSSVNVELGFRPAEEYVAPELSASGCTSMNQAMITALDEIQARKELYKQNGVKWYRPWLFVLTDGAPTDDSYESEAIQKVRSAIEGKKITYMPMGIGPGADTKQLQKYYPENCAQKIVLKANAENFKSAFQWLSASLTEISHSNPNLGQVKVPDTPPDIVVGL